MNTSNIGIIEKMSLAKNPEEVASLLDEVKGYKRASSKTIRKCERIAKQKMKGFNGPTTPRN